MTHVKNGGPNVERRQVEKYSTGTTIKLNIKFQYGLLSAAMGRKQFIREKITAKLNDNSFTIC